MWKREIFLYTLNHHPGPYWPHLSKGYNYDSRVAFSHKGKTSTKQTRKAIQNHHKSPTQNPQNAANFLKSYAGASSVY